MRQGARGRAPVAAVAAALGALPVLLEDAEGRAVQEAERARLLAALAADADASKDAHVTYAEFLALCGGAAARF